MSSDEPINYRIEFTEPAEAEIETIILNRLRIASPELVTQWYRGLTNVADSLSLFPRHYPLMEPENYEGEVRRVIYGRNRDIYYLTYRVSDPDAGDVEGVVRILHVRSAAQQFATPSIGREA